MALVLAARAAAAVRPALKPALHRSSLQPVAKTSISTTSRRFVATKARLLAATHNWLSFTVLTAVVSAPLALWFLHDGTGIVPDLDKYTAMSECVAKNFKGPSPEKVTKMLNEDAYTVLVGNVANGVTRYDGAQLAAQYPCEDRYTHGSMTMPPHERWMVWGIFDGYFGPQMAETLSYVAATSVRDALKEHFDSMLQEDRQGKTENTPKDLSRSAHARIVQKILRKTMPDLDFELMNSTAILAEAILRADDDGSMKEMTAVFANSSFADQVTRALNAWSGAGSLLTMYDPTRDIVHVATTGKSRAVLGVYETDKNLRRRIWRARPMSAEQARLTPKEEDAFRRKHPGEEEVVLLNGRPFGRPTSHAFGDLRTKLPVSLQQALCQVFGLDVSLTWPIKESKTPPYMNAKPSTSFVEIRNRPCFLIMASDGFWQYMTDQNAVDLVTFWLAAGSMALDKGHPGKLNTIDISRYISRDSSRADVRSLEATPIQGPLDLTTPYRHDTMAVKDGNATVHLIRNALGGSNAGLLATRLAFQPPYARMWRDDMTVQVIFFHMDALALLKF
ncbi:MAG: hypothetical protein STHCBS139747_001044 [Sporothrix thermara]